MIKDKDYIETYDRMGHKFFSKGSDEQLREWGHSEKSIIDIKIRSVRSTFEVYARGIELYKTLLQVAEKKQIITETKEK
jgi:hypothetical protein